MRLAFNLLYTLFILRNKKQQRDNSAGLSHRKMIHHSERPYPMKTLIALINDEAGFIVSAELVLVSTIAVLAMIVGLSEVAININNELEDVGSAFGSINQTYCVKGILGCQGYVSGTEFRDNIDTCDATGDIQSASTQGEGSGHGSGQY
jgi:hypothetical protein